jgi:hypothetical protein
MKVLREAKCTYESVGDLWSSQEGQFVSMFGLYWDLNVAVKWLTYRPATG